MYLSNSISPQLFQKFANEIIEMFPSELVGTYYVPYRDKKRPQSGRLYDHFTFLKRELFNDGILLKKKRLQRRLQTLLEIVRLNKVVQVVKLKSQ